VVFERAGLPSALIVLDTFSSLATTKKRQMGLPQLEVITVPGPMGVPDVARAKGDAVLDDVVRCLTVMPGAS
jgi:hypothetical protein